MMSAPSEGGQHSLHARCMCASSYLCPRLYRLLEVQIPGLQLNPDERSTCLKVAHSVSLRMNTLQGVEAAINDGPSHQPAQKLSLDQARALQQVIQDLFDKPQNAAAFPIELRNYTARMDKQGSDHVRAHSTRACVCKESR